MDYKLSNMIPSLRLLLGANIADCQLKEENYKAAIDMAYLTYQRFEGVTDERIFTTGEYSWIHDYALAQCTMLVGMLHSNNVMIESAAKRIKALENQLD